jgi:hypothetical protein
MMDMTITLEQLDSFHHFACEQLKNGGAGLSLEELLDRWRMQYPSPDELRENVLAVKASIRDMESGVTGRPFDDFARDFRNRNGIADDL